MLPGVEDAGLLCAFRIGRKVSKELGHGFTRDFVTDNVLLTDEDSMYCDRLFGREALPKLSGEFGTVAFVRTRDAHRDLQDVEMLGRAE